MRKRLLAIVVPAITALALTAPPLVAGVETGFGDVDDEAIMATPMTWLRLSGITSGCNPPLNTSFCPDEPVTRGQMAAFVARAAGLGQVSNTNHFRDDDGSIFESAINSIADVGITRGCNPPDNDQFCPASRITREQMAAFLVRAFDLPEADDAPNFADVTASIFAGEISALAGAGIALGCNPPTNDRYCPTDYVTRSELATFLWRIDGRTDPGTPARIVAAGDIARCEVATDDATASLIDALFRNTNGVVAALGDTVYDDGSAAQYEDCYQPTWGRHLFRTYPAVGNHEYRTPDAGGYFDYFGPAAGDPDTGWYAYSLNGWQLVVLNTNCDEIGGCQAGSAQETWLRDQLTSNPAQCVLAYMHHPRFSSGPHGDDSEIAYLWQALDDHGVDVVLAGHDHHYERFAPMSAAGEQVADGTRSFVVGTGGTYLRDVNEQRPASEAVIDDRHGVLVLDLTPSSYRWQFIDTGFLVLDEGTGSCS